MEDISHFKIDTHSYFANIITTGLVQAPHCIDCKKTVHTKLQFMADHRLE